MRSCCVPYCKSNGKSTGLSFHNFPRNERLQNAWIRAIGHESEIYGTFWTPSKYSFVCSKHFQKSDFSISTKNKILLPNTVPSVFPGHSQCAFKNKKANWQPIDDFDMLTTDTTFEDFIDYKKNNDIDIDVQMESRSTEENNFKFEEIRKQNQKLECEVNRLNKVINHLTKALLTKQGIDNFCDTVEYKQIQQIIQNSNNGDLHASFLLDQLCAYGKENPCFLNETLELCDLLHEKSPKGYEFIRDMKILNLPHKSTLKKLGLPCTIATEEIMMGSVNIIINSSDEV